MTDSKQRKERDARRNHERANTRKSAETRRASSKARPVVANPGACSADGRDYVADGRQETTDRRQNKHANAANATRRGQRNEDCRIAKSDSRTSPGATCRAEPPPPPNPHFRRYSSSPPPHPIRLS